MTRSSVILAVSVAMSGLFGCGADDDELTPWGMAGKGEDQLDIQRQELIERYRGHFSPEQEQRRREMLRRPHKLYLNFGQFGSTIIRGGEKDDATNNISSLVQGQITIPQFEDDFYLTFSPFAQLLDMPNARETFINETASIVRRLLPDQIYVYTSPPDPPYTMVVVGGKSSLFPDHDSTDPFPSSSDLLGSSMGLAPRDCGDTNPSNIAFVFNFWAASKWSFFPKTTLATAIVHMAGHTFGLSHIDGFNTIMAPRFTPAANWGEGNVLQDKHACLASYQKSHELLVKNVPDRIRTHPLHVCAGQLTNLGCCLGTNRVWCASDGVIRQQPCIRSACGWRPDVLGTYYPFTGEYDCIRTEDNRSNDPFAIPDPGRPGMADPEGRVPISCPAEALAQL